jgi:uncharacterized LabA/DUF88 family protein
MSNQSLCRIGIFYDGSYFTYAQLHFYADRNLGWLSFMPLHRLIEDFIREKEQGYFNYRVVYAGWYQGLYTSTQSTDHQRRIDRNRHIDLIYAGIEPKYMPMSQEQGEKGIDIAMAIDALQVGLDGKIDVAVLITGDGDFVPLVRALMKHGIRVATAYFEYESERRRSFASERLMVVSNYVLNITDLEKDRKNQGLFRSLFKASEKGTFI